MSTIGGELDVVERSAMVRLAGELDLAAVADVMELTRVALHRGVLDELIIDLSEVTFIDAAGLGALVITRKLADSASVDIVLQGMSPRLVRIFQITGLAEQFGIPSADAGRC